MNLRFNTLWRVPVFCIVFSWISYYLSVYIGGFFFKVATPSPDGTVALSIDSLRSAVFRGCLFVVVLLMGGFWFFRSMTKREIAVSAAIISGLYLAIVLAQLFVSNFPVSLSIKLAPFQNWPSTVASFLQKLTNNFEFSILLANLAPFLFVPFGKKSTQ